MRVLLDENFPLALVRRLRDEGHDAEHIILLGLRGSPDSRILKRLNSEEVLFLTHDLEFLDLSLKLSTVIVSRITQSLLIGTRVDIWLKAIREYFSREWPEKLFEVFDDRKLSPWEVIRSDA